MSEDNQKIEIQNVSGDVTISQDQTGGVTSHTIEKGSRGNKKRKSLPKWIYWAIGFIASILTILSYFGFAPTKEGKMFDKKDSPITVGNVSGDVVISQNQSGGITAHSININEPIPPEWSISPSEKVKEGEWRTKLGARGKGRLAYYNWNILLTLNTQIIRREDVPGEVTVGPWMPLEVVRGRFKPEQFFIGFSEFKPGQSLSVYLYSREPLKVLRVDTVSDK